jgi:hypothetical protein
MSEERLRQIFRQFPQNGMKLLLSEPANVRELLALAEAPLLSRIDFSGMKVEPTDFVTRDFRHVESDLVLSAPLRPGKGRRARQLLLYVLIEHQSEPDRLMPLRLLDYLVQLWKHQVRQWGQQHGGLASVRLSPILPVVFYTGTWAWESVGELPDLFEEGELFRAVTPLLTPLFVSLPGAPAAALEAGGPFGWLLRLVQQRRSSARTFEGLLRRAVGRLEAIADEERLRWLELLTYLHALVHHERQAGEREQMQRLIEASVQTDEHRQEVVMVRKTGADAYREEGAEQGRREEAVRSRQEMLVRLLRRRFKEVPAATEAVIQKTADVGQLEAWLEQMVTAKTLKEIGIGAKG